MVADAAFRRPSVAPGSATGPYATWRSDRPHAVPFDNSFDTGYTYLHQFNRIRTQAGDEKVTEAGYTMGYSEEFRQLLVRRSADSHAAHLLPLLQPGMRVLDFGCGPGNISVGLASAVNPGELHGIDMEESQIDLARSAARAGGHDNASFHLGDVTELPFEDNSFDVAHCHAVLMHVPDTERVLSEVRRVLRPGGMICSREVIVESSFLEPSSEHTLAAWATFTGLVTANGGHPQMGKELKGRFLAAGFTDIWTSGSFDFFGTPEDVAFLHAFVADWFYSPQVMEAVTKYGLASRQQFAEWRSDHDRWRDEAGAVGALAFGEAIGRKP